MVKQTWLAAAAVIALSDVAARAVIVTGPGTAATPGRNTTAPTGTLAGSGWELQGTFGAYLGTAVSSNFFLTAAHFGLASNTITVGGVTHSLTGNAVFLPGTDLVLREVNTAFAADVIAPIYDPAADGVLTTTDQLVVFGRGTARGTAVSGKGWLWGDSDTLMSWGTNAFSGLTPVDEDKPDGPHFLYSYFNNGVGANEATLSNGDSGGGVFVYKNGAWRLVGINYGVELFRQTTGNTGTPVAAYNAVGLYEQLTSNPDTYGYIAGPSRQQAWLASYIPDSLTSLRSMVPPAVPEPALLGVGMVVGAGLMRRRRRGRTLTSFAAKPSPVHGNPVSPRTK